MITLLGGENISGGDIRDPEIDVAQVRSPFAYADAMRKQREKELKILQEKKNQSR